MISSPNVSTLISRGVDRVRRPRSARRPARSSCGSTRPTGSCWRPFHVTVNDTFQFCEFVPTFTDVSAPIAGPAGSHRVYLVAKAADGGPTTNLFKVTFIEFGS